MKHSGVSLAAGLLRRLYQPVAQAVTKAPKHVEGASARLVAAGGFTIKPPAYPQQTSLRAYVGRLSVGLPPGAKKYSSSAAPPIIKFLDIVNKLSKEELVALIDKLYTENFHVLSLLIANLFRVNIKLSNLNSFEEFGLFMSKIFHEALSKAYLSNTDRCWIIETVLFSPLLGYALAFDEKTNDAFAHFCAAAFKGISLAFWNEDTTTNTCHFLKCLDKFVRIYEHRFDIYAVVKDCKVNLQACKDELGIFFPSQFIYLQEIHCRKRVLTSDDVNGAAVGNLRWAINECGRDRAMRAETHSVIEKLENELKWEDDKNEIEAIKTKLSRLKWFLNTLGRF